MCGPQTSRYLTGCFYADITGILEAQFESSISSNNVTTTLQAAVNADNKGQWLLLMRPQGIMEVRLSVCTLVSNSTNYLTDLDFACTDFGVLHRWPLYAPECASGFPWPACAFAPSGSASEATGSRCRAASAGPHWRELAAAASLCTSIPRLRLECYLLMPCIFRSFYVPDN